MAEDRRKKEFEGRKQNFGLDDKINSAVMIIISRIGVN